MLIHELYGADDAPRATGLAVVIDVLRAFTTAAYAFNAGAKQIILVSTAAEAFRLKRQDSERLLVGEDGGRKIAGFDHGNSPEDIERLDLNQRELVLRSSSGTQGVVGAKAADAIYLGSLVVASATVRAIRASQASEISLLAMGAPGIAGDDDDIACRDLMAKQLRGESISHEQIARRVAASRAGLEALDPDIDFKSTGDLARAVMIDRFDFALPVRMESGLLVARPFWV